METIKKDESKVAGGVARAKALTKKERSDIAKKAAAARWDMRATHEGVLEIGDLKIPCAVLENGQRLLTQSGFMKALGRARQAKGREYYDSDVDMPAFLTAKNLKPFISEELKVTSSQVKFETKKGAKAFGYPAELLPKVCDVFIDAEEAKELHPTQVNIAKQAKILMRALAHVGIIALVDEATGYQYDRARHALAEILETFISKELIKWVSTFPDEFYHHIFRLKGWKPLEIANRRPKIFGKITNDLVYRRLTANVLKHLEQLNPKDEKGRRKHKHFQRLTIDIGHPELRALLASEITVMRGFEDGDWDGFYKFLNRVLPKQTPLPLFDEIPDDYSEAPVASSHA